MVSWVKSCLSVYATGLLCCDDWRVSACDMPVVSFVYLCRTGISLTSCTVSLASGIVRKRRSCQEAVVSSETDEKNI